MRATLGSVVRHPSYLPDWWFELPGRRRSWWLTLLFEPGQGWLRWGFDSRIASAYIDEGLYAPEPYPVAPPFRRLWLNLKWNLGTGWLCALRGDVRWSEVWGFEDTKMLRAEDRLR